MVEKFHIKNIDCQECAANIEAGVKKLKGVSFVSVNLATGLMHLDADDTRLVIDTIKKIEPKVEVMKEGESESIKKNPLLSLEGAVIIFSSVLFILGLIFKETLHNTPHKAGEYGVFLFAYLLSGHRVLLRAVGNLFSGRLFDETFLMSVATVGALALHEMPEAVGVMLFYKIGEFFENLSVNRSRKSIRSLLEIHPDYANLKKDKELVKVQPESVEPGDVIVIKPGEKVPLDGEVISGTSLVDASTLTGESVPKTVRSGSAVLAGMINGSGVLEVKVSRSYGESSVSKILDLVENASANKADTEKFITKIARYYTPAVVGVAVVIAVLPPLVSGSGNFSMWIYRALILLVISCPCALVISIPLGYFAGVGLASKRGILVKGANFLDALCHVKTVVFDKTGTLTKGVFKVVKVVTEGNFTGEEILQAAAEAESQSNHPIAHSIAEAYGKDLTPRSIEHYEEIAGSGVIATIGGRRIIAGNDRLMHREKISHGVCRVAGTVVHVAMDGTYAGYVVIADELKEDAGIVKQSLSELGVERVVMLTGDGEDVASNVSEKLGFDAYHAGLLPEQKVEAIERIMREERPGNKVAFVGDGINDAPVIARADVGVAMGALGSDAAIETADVVIMTDMPSKVAEAIGTGKRTRTIVWQNIALALSVKAAFISLGIMGLATMWEAVFADVGVAILAVFNATRMLKGKV